MIPQSFIRSFVPWVRVCLKLVWAAYMLTTSLYCLLAFFPYTYYALIKSPVYEWMPWFAQHHGNLYWLALLAALGAYYKRVKLPFLAVVLAGLGALGIYISLHPLLSTMTGGGAAYKWGMAV